MKRIRKAVLPVAGLGTRFLPATKASPKEMLSIVDKPLIQHAVEEAVTAGIEHIIFVTASQKRAIEDHFDRNAELENLLTERGKDDLLAELEAITPSGITYAYTRQHQALGLGHAILCAQPLVGDEAFAVILADDLIDATPGCLSQMVASYDEHMDGLIAVEAIDPQDSDKYGILVTDQDGRIRHMVEKPKPAEAPSNLAAIGRYILPPSLFTALAQTPAGAGGEIQLTDAIYQLLSHQNIHAITTTGQRFDCGSKLGFAKANLHYALQHPQIGPTFRGHLQQVVAELQA